MIHRVEANDTRITRAQEVQLLPDWGKVEFHAFSPQSWDEILPGASSNGRDLARQLLCYESKERLSAEEVGDSDPVVLGGV